MDFEANSWGFGRVFDYASIPSVKSTTDVYAEDRLVFQVTAGATLPKTVLLGKRPHNSKKKGECVLEDPAIVELVQRVVSNPLPAPAVPQVKIDEPPLAFDDGEDIFGDVEKFDLEQELRADDRKSRVEKRGGAAEAVECVEAIMASAKGRLEAIEADEEQERLLTLSFLESTSEAPKPRNNPFSLKEASLIPLRNLPVSAHHIKQSVVQNLLSEDTIDADEEYGIDLTGEAARSNNNQPEIKRRRGGKSAMLENVKVITEMAARGGGLGGAPPD